LAGTGHSEPPFLLNACPPLEACLALFPITLLRSFPQLQKPFLREIAVNLKHLRIIALKLLAQPVCGILSARGRDASGTAQTPYGATNRKALLSLAQLVASWTKVSACLAQV